MAMTERERRHFAAIAEAMQAEGDERRREAAARGGIEKVLEGSRSATRRPRPRRSSASSTSARSDEPSSTVARAGWA